MLKRTFTNWFYFSAEIGIFNYKLIYVPYFENFSMSFNSKSPLHFFVIFDFEML